MTDLAVKVAEDVAEESFAEVLRCFTGLSYISGLATLIRDNCIYDSQHGGTGTEDAAMALIGGVLAVHGCEAIRRARAEPTFPYASLTDAELLEQARLAWAKAGTRDRRKTRHRRKK